MCKPFLKWAGGKTRLMSELLSRIPKFYEMYYELFAGSASLFFSLSPQESVLSDVNKDLINTFREVANNPDEIIEYLDRFQNTESFYYDIRDLDRQNDWNEVSSVIRAARFIYLNKTCFNGLYRVNKKNQFNVPYGKYKKVKFFDKDNLYACSRLLKKSTVICLDYKQVYPMNDSFVYLDPPYVPLSATSSFTAYTSPGFSLKNHKELFEYCEDLDKRGVKWMQSNSSSPIVLDTYKSYNIEMVDVRRNIAAQSENRQVIKEVIIRNYE